MQSINPFHGYKGLGAVPEGTTPISQVGSLNWNILEESVSLPAAVLELDKLSNNLDWMEEFLSTFETKLLVAPHGKTTMMPLLFKKVLEKPSSWGITLATAVQVQTAHSFGISKIMMANQLVGKANMEIISALLAKDTSFEFMSIVDSAENVRQLGKFFSEKRQTINILLEYGPTGGRTGIRDETQEADVLTALEEWKATVNLIGIEFYEGILKTEDSIRSFIKKVLSRAKELIINRKFEEKSVIITGAGSAWFDVVAEELSKFSNDNPKFILQLILRPGCYMIHDTGLYKEATLRIESKKLVKETLQPALKIWACVQSIPEPNLSIVAFGKRDGAIDCGFPVPKLHFRPGVFEKPVDFGKVENWEIINMMDQHTFMKISEGDDIIVGDMIGFDIAHPCTTIDKWRNLLVMDENYSVVDVYQTFF